MGSKFPIFLQPTHILQMLVFDLFTHIRCIIRDDLVCAQVLQGFGYFAGRFDVRIVGGSDCLLSFCLCICRLSSFWSWLISVCLFGNSFSGSRFSTQLIFLFPRFWKSEFSAVTLLQLCWRCMELAFDI